MTPDENAIICSLHTCCYQPGSWSSKFVKNMFSLVMENPDADLTEGQREWIYRVLYKMRKSLPYTYKKYKTHKHCKKAPKENKTILPHVAGDWKPQRTNGDLKRGNGGVQTTLPIF